MATTVQQGLPQELVALIHHVELSESGWYDQLLDQLVLSLLFLDDSPCTLENLKSALRSRFGFAPDESTLRNSITRLGKSEKLAVTDGKPLRLTDLTIQETRTTVTANQSLDQRVARHFKELVTQEAPEIDPEDCWNSFCADCLEPLVIKLGARTYEIIANPAGGSPDIHSIVGCMDKYPLKVRQKIDKLIDRFLDPENQDVRNFVLNRLHCHLLTLAVSLPEHSLSKLVSRSKSNIQLKLFLDTNFLFSLLDLHENPANPVAKDLIEVLDNIKNHVRSQLYVFPPTIDEAKQPLKASQRDLDNLEVLPRLGRIARGTTTGQGSGIRARYLRASATASYPLTGASFLGPYLNNFVAVIRGKNVEVFNERTDSLFELDQVNDDIHNEECFQSQFSRDRQKGFEAIRHDVALWHFVERKRYARVDTPLDAIYWIVTVDNSMIRFDRQKVKDRHDLSVPICVHPATLMQMLRLWAPRTDSFDRAMIHSVRSLLPQAYNTDVEVVTLNILRSLSRFEGADQLPEKTVSSVLLNRAVQAGMKDATIPDEQNQLVKEALLKELKSARHQVDQVQDRELETQRRLQQEQERTKELSERRRLDEKATKKLESDLRDERKWNKELVSRLDDLTREHDLERTERDQFLQRMCRIIFSCVTLVLTPILVAIIVLITHWAGTLFGYQGLRITVTGAVIGCYVAAFAICYAGRRIKRVRSWRVFQWFQSKRKSFFAVPSAICISTITKMVDGGL